jgi:hypothetical protein
MMAFALWLGLTVVGSLIGCAIGHLIWKFIERSK